MGKLQTYEGPIMIRAKGTGFFSVEGIEEDILIPPESLSFALDGDIVEIEVLPKVSGRRQEGKIVRVIEPAHDEFVGIVKKHKTQNGYFLLPDNYRIHVRPLLPEASSNDEG